MNKFKVGDIIRHDSGSTALMKITSVSPNHGGYSTRYYGRSFYGSPVGVFQMDAKEATPEEITRFKTDNHLNRLSSGYFSEENKSVEIVLRKSPRLKSSKNVSLTHEEFQHLKDGQIHRIHVRVSRYLTLKVHVKPFMVEKAQNRGRYWLVPYSEKSKLVQGTQKTLPVTEVEKEIYPAYSWLKKLSNYWLNI